MTRNISPVESIYNIIQYWLEKEMKTGGVLTDVNLLIPSSGRYDNLDAPLIWMEKQEITTTPISHSNKMALKVPLSIICCDEIIDTIVEAEASSCNIACRCITSLLLNMIEPRPVGNNVHLRDFRIERFYPNITPTGAFEIQSKAAMMAATRVDVLFTFDVDWTLYEQLQGEVYVPVEYGDLEDVTTEIVYNVDAIGGEESSSQGDVAPGDNIGLDDTDDDTDDDTGDDVVINP